MTGADLRAHLGALHWGRLALARELQCSVPLVDKWLADARPVPDVVAAWLRRRVASDRADPAPRGWQRRGVRHAA